MRRTTRAPLSEDQRARSLAEVEALAWLLDNSIPVPGTGGRRFGVDAIIGIIPGVGDVVSGIVGLLVVWRGSRMGLSRIVVARMLLNALLDIAIGAIPIIGDAFDLWFKASTRNLALMRRHLERPDISTREDWTAVLVVVGLAVAVIGAILWLIVAVIGAIIGALS